MLTRSKPLLVWIIAGLCCWPTAVADYTPEALADQVDWSALPGADELAVKDAFNMFAGYVTVDENNGRRIFYWFMEAQENAQEAPVILWTNGGPGCSGMLGLLTEHGPFQVRDGGETLVDNEFSWNKLANMLYVEIPSGVGFSYSDTTSDYKTGDDATAVDNYRFVQGWLDRFPNYRSNDFHISSESYGGHYMPQMAEEILKRNELSGENDGSDPPINFVGFLVGNPYTDALSNEVAQYEAYWGDQLLPKPVYDEWRKECVEGGYRPRGNDDLCDELEEAMDTFIGNLNPYALDFPMCTEGVGENPIKGFPIRANGGRLQQGSKRAIPRAPRVAMREQLRRAWREGYLKGERAHVRASTVSAPYEPCAEDYTVQYFNRADVQAALHVKKGLEWMQCSMKVNYKASDMLRPMMSYYKRLLDNYNIKILVFSGDDDAVCATEGTQWWIYDLGYDIDESRFWKTWEEGGQVAGYETRFKGARLSFVTVHSAGHEVPAYQPARALKLLAKYLDGSWWGLGGQEDSVADMPNTATMY